MGTTLPGEDLLKTLDDKVAIIFGASRGIGAAAARAFAREGARLVLASRDHAMLAALADELRSEGHEAAVAVADVTDEASVAAAIGFALERFGGIDIAFNNSGVSSPAYRMHETPVDEFDRLMSINLRGMFLAMKHELAAMLDRGGVIVNNASISGVSAVPNISAYNASKHGVIGLTKSAAAEYARLGIRVNAVAPGAIMTDMLANGIASTPQGRGWLNANVPIGRIGAPDDVAEAVLWLASDAAAYLTGVTLPVDGGYLVSRGSGQSKGEIALPGARGN